MRAVVLTGGGNVTIITRIDTDRKVRTPEEWGEEFAPEQEVELVPHEDGLLVRPTRKSALKAALERKVVMNQPTHIDLSDLDMDTLGW
jgi:hypothetical protein